MMEHKTDDELRKYINTPEKYTAKTLKNALNEFTNRQLTISDDELKRVNDAIKNEAHFENLPERELLLNPWNKNVVTEENAPRLYSQRAVWGFSIFFTVIFGAVLLANNIHDRTKKWVVIGYGLIYTTIAIVLLNQLPRNTGLTFLANGIGAIILTSIFWNKYIGKDVKYRTKPIWKPLIISIIITLPILIAIIFFPEE